MRTDVRRMIWGPDFLGGVDSRMLLIRYYCCRDENGNGVLARSLPVVGGGIYLLCYVGYGGTVLVNAVSATGCMCLLPVLVSYDTSICYTISV